MLRRLKLLPQQDKIFIAHRGFIAESRDQRVLAVLQVIPIMDVALLGGNLRAQPVLQVISIMDVALLGGNLRAQPVLQVISIMDVALLGHNLRAQPPKLLIILTTLFAHTRSIDSRGSRSCRIVSHR